MGEKINPLDSIVVFTLVLVQLSPTSSLKCDDAIVRGVNLGGWLLLEPWVCKCI